MVKLEHDNSIFNVTAYDMYIGHIWCRADNIWLFESDIETVPEGVLSVIEDILHTLNLANNTR